MKKRKVLAVFLAVAMVFCYMPTTAVADSVPGAFKDMPKEGFWSTTALEAAVGNGLLNGFVEKDGTYIKPNDPLTRAQMATIVNRAFGAGTKAALTGVADVASNAWYLGDMQKAVQMGTMKLDILMRPNDSITRQEAFTILARAFKMTDGTATDLAGFSDGSQVASWAVPGMGALVKAGYVQGSDNMLTPTAQMTRAQFAVIMNNMIQDYITQAGTVTSVASGNVMVNVPGVTLKDVTIQGDLIVGDGVGNGDVTLDNVTIKGDLIARGGGVNSIIIVGGGVDGKIIIAKVDGQIRVSVEGGAEVEVIVIDDGKDDVIIEGTVGTVEVTAPDTPIIVQNATVTNIEIKSEGAANVMVASNATVTNVVVGTGSTGTTLNVEGRVTNVQTSAANTNVGGTGTVTTVTTNEGANNTAVTTPGTKVNNDGATGVTAGGGTEVPSGSTATNSNTGGEATVQPTTGGTTGGGGAGGNATPQIPASTVERDPGNTGGASASFDASTNTFSGTIDFYAAASGFPPVEGNYVGVKITAPDVVTVDSTNATFKYTNASGVETTLTGTWLDGDNFVYYYPLVTDVRRSFSIEIDWDGPDGYAPEVITITVAADAVLAFPEPSDLGYELEFDDWYKVWMIKSYSGTETQLTIPDYFTMGDTIVSVGAIGSMAFKNATIVSVTIPNTASYIFRNAFEGCTNLTSIDLGDNVREISQYAFSGCTDLTTFIIPDSVTTLDTYAFSGCTRLETVTIGSGLSSLSNNLFEGCSILNNVTIPSNITVLGLDTFKNCVGLTNITIEGNVRGTIGGAFGGCSALTAVTIGSNVTSLGNHLFHNHAALTSITIPVGVTEFGQFAFSGTGLTSIEIPSSVTTLGNYVFLNCNALGSIAIPDTVTSLGTYAFSGCTTLNNVTIGTGLTEIKEYTFAQCPSLISIEIPDNINSIGMSAFIGTYESGAFTGENLNSITIGGDVSIADYMFGGSRDSFKTTYEGGGKIAGTYVFAESTWSKQE